MSRWSLDATPAEDRLFAEAAEWDGLWTPNRDVTPQQVEDFRKALRTRGIVHGRVTTGPPWRRVHWTFRRVTPLQTDASVA